MRLREKELALARVVAPTIADSVVHTVRCYSGSWWGSCYVLRGLCSSVAGRAVLTL